jgi:curved DNA-binding protein CbpA
MVFDPYKTLRLRRNASRQAIQKAFRRRSMETHPDRGGDKAEFEQVRLAYAILSDAERRAQFDGTGEYADGPSNPQNSVFACLSDVFKFVIVEMAAHDPHPSRTDVIAGMRENLQKRSESISQEREGTVKAGMFFELSCGRFVGQDNPFPGMVDYHLRQLEARLDKLNREDADIGAALKILAGYRYRTDILSRCAGSACLPSGMFAGWTAG